MPCSQRSGSHNSDMIRDLEGGYIANKTLWTVPEKSVKMELYSSKRDFVNGFKRGTAFGEIEAVIQPNSLQSDQLKQFTLSEHRQQHLQTSKKACG